MLMQTITFRFTAADLVDAYGYALKTSPFVRGLRLVSLVTVSVCLLVGGWRAFRHDWSGVNEMFGWLVVAVGVMVWTLVIDRWQRRSIRKSFASDKTFQGDFLVSWNEDQIVVEGGRGRSQWPWTDFWRWQESPGGLMLWQSDKLYQYVPKRSLTSGQIEEMRGYLTAAVGKPGQRRK